MDILAKCQAFAKTSALLAVLTVAGGCVYRFTNVVMKPPAGVYSVAIEAIYDTSREVIPHEYLWVELQRAFAASGKVRVTSQKNADALVRAHITSASIESSGSTEKGGGGLGRDTQLKRGEDPPFPSHFRNLNVSGRFAENVAMSFSVTVEIWDLNKRKLIKSGSYSGGAATLSHRGTSQQAQFIVLEEALQNNFKVAARGIADRVVNDFLL